MSPKSLSLGLAALAAGGVVAALVLSPKDASSAAAPPVNLPPAPTYAAADWKKLDAENLLVIDTNKGRVVVELTPFSAPEHVARIKTLVRQGFYDGLVFFRVIDDFMAQTGDKQNTGAGENADIPMLKGTFSFRRGPETNFAGVPSGRGPTLGLAGPLPVVSQTDDLMALTADGKVKAYGVFCPGVAGMARTSDPDSASSQFFLMRQTSHALDERYTPWGKVVVGLDVVRAIAAGEPPSNPDRMVKVQIAADMPAAERPNVWRVDPTSATFRQRLAAISSARGAELDPCDFDLPTELRK